MGRIVFAVVAMIVFAAVLYQARAEEVGRFTMSPTDDGFLRLDTQSGAISLCRKKGERWACASVADDRLALMREIDRLTRENHGLTNDLKELKRSQPIPPNGTDVPRSSTPKFDFPSEEEVDEAMKFVEGLLQRFKDMVENLQKRPENKSERRL